MAGVRVGRGRRGGMTIRRHYSIEEGRGREKGGNKGKAIKNRKRENELGDIIEGRE